MNPYDAVDGTIVLSKFHGEILREFDGYEGPLLYASNGIDPREFPEPDESKRDPHAAIYAAAPERGLELLLAAWPLIREAVPDATLRVYYSWVLTEKMLLRRPNAGLSALLLKLKAGMEALKDQGVTYLGGVSHQVLHEAYRTSGIWAYPPEKFHEISCISALKAQASGCWPVIIPTGALPETCPNGMHVPIGSGPVDYAAAVVAAMQYPANPDERAELRRWALAQNWDKSADQFIAAALAPNERVTIYAGGFGRRFDTAGSADGLPLGGSEEAVISMAKALTAKGKRVFVYAPLPERIFTARPNDAGTWLDSSTFDPAGPHGTLLAWRCPSLVPKLKGNGYPVILWLMDPHYRALPCDYAEADDVVFLTETHKEIIAREDGYDGGGSVVPIGLPPLPDPSFHFTRESKSVMWATSPDRGLLDFLLYVWPRVIDAVPDAKLHVFYGLEPLEKARKADLAHNIRLAMKVLEGSVTYHGGVPDAELYSWYQRCGVFAYRAVGFEETQSLAVCKALALGCWPVVNNVGCLAEVVHLAQAGTIDQQNNLEHYIEILVQSLQGINEGNRSAMVELAREQFSVSASVEKMLKVIEGVQ